MCGRHRLQKKVSGRFGTDPSGQASARRSAKAGRFPVAPMNRIFISYRTIDGAKDASRLADDLGRVFGDDQVFLDRQDLRGGSSWRQEIARAIGHRPVVLLLITPGFAAARHPDGRLRLDDADDPVRLEVESAIDAGAVLMPLRVDGTPMPHADDLPPSMHALTERHALPLRTDDWSRLDLPRIIADIERLGVAPAGTPAAPRPRMHALRWALAAAVLLLTLAGVRYAARDDLVLPPTAAGPRDASPPPPDPSRPLEVKAAEPARGSLEGRWLLTTADGDRIPLTIRQQGERLLLRSEPLRIDNDPDWRAYLDTLAAMKAGPLTHILFTAEGRLSADRADLAVLIASAEERGEGSFVVDTGHLDLRVGPEGRVMAGSLQLNSGERDTVVLARQP